jgi:hypothetical protein
MKMNGKIAVAYIFYKIARLLSHIKIKLDKVLENIEGKAYRKANNYLVYHYVTTEKAKRRKSK